MSEYQYYEFRALDRPLTQAQMGELRAYSSRAQITSTGFVNVYNWGSFKGDANKWMEIYFDAFIYVANWGTRRLVFRVPKRLLDLETASMYCTDESLSCRTKNEHAILSFDSEEEGGDWEEGEGWLPSLTPLRSDLLQGDLRSLYLGWLVAAQEGQLEEDTLEPPVPPGLQELGVPLRSLADFLRIDPDLITAAAEGSAPQQACALTHDEIAEWVAQMPPKAKDAVIAALLEGKDAHFTVQFRLCAVREIQSARNSGGDFRDSERRSVGQLMARAESITKERKKKEAEIRAREKAKRERERAEAHKKHIESLVGKEDGLWSKVDALIATRQPNRYDEAVSLLQDLHDLAGIADQGRTFSSRMNALCREHGRKPSLLDRFRKANLLG